MSIIGRLIEVGMFSKMLAEKSVFRRMLPSLLSAIALAVITGMMLFTVLLGIFYLAYHVMVANNIAPVCATWVAAIAFICITLIFALLTVRSIRCIRRDLMPMPTNFRSVIDAFLNGILR